MSVTFHLYRKLSEPTNLEYIHVSSSLLSRYVLDEAANRFGNLVVLLMANKPYKFLQFSK